MFPMMTVFGVKYCITARGRNWRVSDGTALRRLCHTFIAKIEMFSLHSRINIRTAKLFDGPGRRQCKRPSQFDNKAFEEDYADEI